jgi:hypothetical protein
MENYRSQRQPDQPKPSIIRRLIWELITAFIPAILMALFINTLIPSSLKPLKLKLAPACSPIYLWATA